VVDERTYRTSRNAVNFESVGDVELRGKEYRQPVWRASGLRSRYGVAVEEEAGGPMIGRRDELSLLTDTFDRAVARASPQLVTIVGEPGVGKSRLLREFRRVIDDRPDLVWWRQGRCLPYGEGVTFWAIGEVIKAQAGVLESEPVETVIEKLHSTVSTLIEDPEEASWVELRLQSLVGLGETQAMRSELFAAWQRFFEALAARNPLILIIEDLHWADEAVLDFISHLLDWAQDSAILIVSTARPEFFTERPDWGGGRRDAVAIGLTPLTDQETAHLLSALTNRPLMDADVHRALIDHSGGNPLYVTEFVRLAEEQGWLDRLGQEGDLPLPDNIAAIIAARLDLLEPEEKSILQAAAVVGRVFWSGALSFVEGLDSAELQRRLRRLVSRELIRPVRRSSMQGQDEYSFAHILVRDGAYRRLTRHDRARLHEATARWLEAVSGERAIDVAELLAYHHATAWELSPRDDPERRRQVYRFQLAAGDRARAFDAARAARFYQAAAALAATGSDRGRPMLELAALRQGTNEEVNALLENAIAAFAESNDLAGQAEAASALGSRAWYEGHAEEADRWQERALHLAEDLEPSPVLAQVLVSAASSKQLRGKEAEALDLVDRALRVAQEVSDTATYARCLVIRGSAALQMGDVKGLEDVEEGLRIHLDRNDTTRVMATYNNLATAQIVLGHLEVGRKTIEESIDYGTNRGLHAYVDWSRNTRNEALFPLGEWDECLKVSEELMAEDAKRGGSQVGVFAKYWSALVRFYRGETSGPISVLEETLSAAREIQDPQVLIPSLTGLIACSELVGDGKRAGSLVAEFHDVGLRHPGFLAGCFADIARTMRREKMSEVLAEMAGRARPIGPWGQADVKYAQANLAELRGDLGSAFDLLAQVIADYDGMSHRFGGTMARIEAARVAGIQAHDDDKARLLVEAESLARSMTAKRLLALIADLRTTGQPEVRARG
jgi:tetratricopeptide (TPR) repeat protein